MKYKIVSDSSSNMLRLEDVAFATVPLKILCGSNEFTDDNNLNLEEMITTLKKSSYKTSTSCPNPNDWLDAFSDAENIFAITITSALSGSYNSLLQAKQDYESYNPHAHVFTIDSLSAGPEMYLIIEKIKECILQELSYDEICQKITDYQTHTSLLFSLQSLTNLANNGRVSHAAAKIAGILGIRMVGIADEHGQLKLLDKCRGEKKAIDTIFKEMKHYGYNGGSVRIAHCYNQNAADTLSSLIKNDYPESDIKIHHCTGLCSYYAEYGGLMIGFEK